MRLLRLPVSLVSCVNTVALAAENAYAPLDRVTNVSVIF